MKFLNISWQRVAEVDSLWQEKADGSNGTIVPFVTSDNSRRDNEMCWLLDGRSLTNPPDLVSQDKGLCDTSEAQDRPSGSGRIRIRRMFHRAESM